MTYFVEIGYNIDMLFDLKHILFIVFSFVALIITFILCKLFIKDPKKKDIVLKVAAILTLIIHYSPLYVDYFTTGRAEIASPMILPLYPCNVAMWLLVIVAFYKNKESKVFRVLAEITFYLGLVGGVCGIAFNEIYANNPTFADWDVLNGLLSHVTLLLGCIYLLIGGYIKIRVANVISIIIGLLLLFVDGLLMIGLYKIFNQEPVNCMFLLDPPLASVPFLNTYVIGLIAIVLFFAITAIYEQIALKKEERWYTKLKEKIQNRRKN